MKELGVTKKKTNKETGCASETCSDMSSRRGQTQACL